jgi:ribosomal protein L29
MKKKDLLELQGKTAPELDNLVLKIRMDMVKAKMELKMRKSKNTNVVSGLKKSLAQILTIKNAKV